MNPANYCTSLIFIYAVITKKIFNMKTFFKFSFRMKRLKSAVRIPPFQDKSARCVSCLLFEGFEWYQIDQNESEGPPQ